MAKMVAGSGAAWQLRKLAPLPEGARLLRQWFHLRVGQRIIVALSGQLSLI
jgi:hypothetical protein